MDAAYQLWLFTGAIGAGGSLICWLMNRGINRLYDDMRSHEERLDNHDEASRLCELRLADFKTEVARDYSRDANVQASLSRIHDRVDKLPQEIVQLLNRFIK